MTKQERDAWAIMYRVYEEFSPGLRLAATLEDHNEMAGELFTAASKTLSAAYYESSDEGRLLILSAYGILDRVFKDAKNRHQKPQEAPQESA